MNDIYSTPESELSPESSGSEFGSVENALAGNYTLDFGETLSEAWSLTNGAKLQLLIAAVLAFFISGAVNAVSTGIFESILGPLGGALVAQIAAALVTTPLFVGLTLLGIRRASNAEIKATSIFNNYDKVIPLFLTYLIMYVLIIIGFILLVIPGIYLSVAYTSALVLAAEKGMSPWQALETSRKAITHKWFTVFGLYIVMSIICGLSAIPLLIGLVWTIPMFVIVSGIIYRNVFGVEKQTLESE